jgi:ferredoxin
MTWRVRVDASVCISSGLCVGTAPDHFAFDKHQHSRPVRDLIEPDEAVRDAAVWCPVEAIRLADAATDEPLEL